MSIFAHYSLALVASLAVFTGCATSTHTGAPVSSIRPVMARLTQEQAISMAEFTAERHGYLLTNYKEPDVSREVHYGWRSQFIYWHVTFESKFSFPDDNFTDEIDDQTHRISLMP